MGNHFINNELKEEISSVSLVDLFDYLISKEL